MATLGLIEYKEASPAVRAVYDDIMATRKSDWINNFWKAIAHDPVTLKRTWEDIKQIMAPGAQQRDSRFDRAGFITQVTLDSEHTFCTTESGDGTGGAVDR